MLVALAAGTALTSVTGRVRTPQAVGDALAKGGIVPPGRPYIIGESVGETVVPRAAFKERIKIAKERHRAAGGPPVRARIDVRA
jgi:hypothetical protein